MTPLVDKKEQDGLLCYSCRQCGLVLVRIEPGGILGEGLGELDLAVISDHYFERHEASPD